MVLREALDFFSEALRAALISLLLPHAVPVLPHH